MITLYEHNRTAYEKAAAMLAERGKAAVIHPTGTGKSFIAFKLAEDNPEARILWLSPSEYIFRTQLENINNACGCTPGNIKFHTYAKLARMDEKEIKRLGPAYIILDEFHRCGAEIWGRGVQKLLAAHPDAPILGLSATNIRYLDNRRDMADELFDGAAASEITLGEAVVKGILTPPEYVLSIYSCAKDIEKYQKRIRRAKTKTIRDQAQKKLDALRRSLENAEGLDQIFLKHIKDRQGKYIIFCSNIEHLKETENRLGEWFGKIDKNPAVYTACSENAETSKTFDAFRKDDTPRLKLLLCIDMLNEGIHIQGTSGVILLRPTASPIIYKQQIGRALSSGKNGKKQTPVIIDIVNNIENLYSVSAIQEEMNAAVNCCKATGQENKIVSETFSVTDETKDSRRLFCELEETLSASWDAMYRLAETYYKKHRSLDIPKRCTAENGCALGSWLNTQRLVYAGKTPGILTEERIAKLNAIGMEWRNRYDAAWDKYYAALCQYRQDNGGIDIKADYTTQNGLKLGRWITNLRAAKACGRKGYYLTDRRIAMLDKLGMIWDTTDRRWEQHCQACEQYYKQHKNLDIPADYATEKGLRIGAWIRKQRKIRDGRITCAAPLTEEQTARLDAIGMNWQDAYTRQWEYGCRQAEDYLKEHGSLDVPAAYVNAKGFPLGKWLKRHTETNAKTGRPAIKITPERKAKLDGLGFKWDKENSWDIRIAACKEYSREHGDLNIPQHYVTTDGIWLGKWLYECRRAYRGETGNKTKKLAEEQIRELESLGVDWRTPSEKAWEEKYAAAAEMLEKTNGTRPAAENGKNSGLRQWLARQRNLMKQGKLTNEQINKLGTLKTTRQAG